MQAPSSQGAEMSFKVAQGSHAFWGKLTQTRICCSGMEVPSCRGPWAFLVASCYLTQDLSSRTSYERRWGTPSAPWTRLLSGHSCMVGCNFCSCWVGWRLLEDDQLHSGTGDRGTACFKDKRTG